MNQLPSLRQLKETPKSKVSSKTTLKPKNKPIIKSLDLQSLGQNYQQKETDKQINKQSLQTEQKMNQQKKPSSLQLQRLIKRVYHIKIWLSFYKLLQETLTAKSDIILKQQREEFAQNLKGALRQLSDWTDASLDDLLLEIINLKDPLYIKVGEEKQNQQKKKNIENLLVLCMKKLQSVNIAEFFTKQLSLILNNLIQPYQFPPVYQIKDYFFWESWINRKESIKNDSNAILNYKINIICIDLKSLVQYSQDYNEFKATVISSKLNRQRQIIDFNLSKLNNSCFSCTHNEFIFLDFLILNPILEHLKLIQFLRLMQDCVLISELFTFKKNQKQNSSVHEIVIKWIERNVQSFVIKLYQLFKINKNFFEYKIEMYQKNEGLIQICCIINFNFLKNHQHRIRRKWKNKEKSIRITNQQKEYWEAIKL